MDVYMYIHMVTYMVLFEAADDQSAHVCMHGCVYIHIHTLTYMARFEAADYQTAHVCMYMYVCVCMRVYVCIDRHEGLFDHEGMNVLRYIYIYIYTLNPKYIHTDRQKHAYIYTHIQTCIYIYIYIHTHTCTVSKAGIEPPMPRGDVFDARLQLKRRQLQVGFLDLLRRHAV